MLDGFELVLFLALHLVAEGLAAQTQLCRSLRLLRSVQHVWHEHEWPLHPSHWRSAARQAAALRALNIAVLPAYLLPKRLTDAVPVSALFVRGNWQLLQWPAVAVVGAREASRDAVAWATRLAAFHARRGELVVSGGARGIDSAAHAGALAAGGPTLAYVGTAIDQVYPPGNKPLFSRILRGGGAIVSEHPPRTRTFAYHHANRNRFIAAHADQLVVVEAAAKSGTLGTADWARKYGRRVWVSPHGVGTQREGVDLLLQNGWADIYGEERTSVVKT